MTVELTLTLRLYSTNLWKFNENVFGYKKWLKIAINKIYEIFRNVSYASFTIIFRCIIDFHKCRMKITLHFSVLCGMAERWQNTVLSYKNGSKFEIHITFGQSYMNSTLIFSHQFTLNGSTAQCIFFFSVLGGKVEKWQK